jgi:hypothetical protein
MAFLSESERQLRANASQSSVTSVRLEGLEPSPQFVEDLQGWSEGELTLDDVRDRLFQRFAEEDRNAGRR